MDPEDTSFSKFRVDPPDSYVMDDPTFTSGAMGGSKLKELAMKRVEARSPKQSLAAKLAAKRAMLLADDDETVGDSTIATSLVSDATTEFSVSEKNSRRALILQMAKARMKGLQKDKIAEDPAESKAEGKNESLPSSSELPEVKVEGRYESPSWKAPEVKVEGRNESPPSWKAPEVQDPETPRDEILPGGGMSGEFSAGLSSLELD